MNRITKWLLFGGTLLLVVTFILSYEVSASFTNSIKEEVRAVRVEIQAVKAQNKAIKAELKAIDQAIFNRRISNRIAQRFPPQ
ncbi:hypothetical protein [Aureispira anguillae]|uniref:Uncharacterized protein n=1 Tax=Aureispira anguillae TaxID=2864201 RepID=A0A915YD83_9BACT|nr:hypothetical protein [Aureispira anguillae]BDS10891.1 hypothetical protein AsAng_0016010 [Aureispira anguillae]